MVSTGYRPPLVRAPGRPFGELMVRIHQSGHFGNLMSESDARNLNGRNGIAQDAVASYQLWHGLAVDGFLGPVTEQHLARPRCGIADVLPARGCVAKWAIPVVTFAHRLSFPGMDANAAFVEAASQFPKVCGIKLQQLFDIEAANIWAIATVLDQAGGILADSYLPNCGSPANTKLAQRYDSRERWTHKFLVAVARHELGHAMGLDHTNVEGNLMNPFYDPRIVDLQPTWDIPELVARYGPPVTTTPPPIDPPIPAVNEAIVSCRIGGRTFAGTAVLAER